MLTAIYNFFVVPTEENVVQLTSQEIEQIQADNARLLQALKRSRADLASAYGLDFVEPVERPSASFVESRERAEAQTGSTFLKFFKL